MLKTPTPLPPKRSHTTDTSAKPPRETINPEAATRPRGTQRPSAAARLPAVTGAGRRWSAGSALPLRSRGEHCTPGVRSRAGKNKSNPKSNPARGQRGTLRHNPTRPYAASFVTAPWRKRTHAARAQKQQHPQIAAPEIQTARADAHRARAQPRGKTVTPSALSRAGNSQQHKRMTALGAGIALAATYPGVASPVAAPNPLHQNPAGYQLAHSTRESSASLRPSG